CPVTLDGLKAITYFADQGISTNATLVFSANQALLAAKAGASYVSPFVGRLDDISREGMGLVKQIVTIFGNYDYMTEVIVSSVRHPQHIIDAALLGADIATIPYRLIRQLIAHPLTDSGLRKFTEDAAIMKK
ncbi:MAG: transaldolase family protein, partial [Chlorobium sp.]